MGSAASVSPGSPPYARDAFVSPLLFGVGLPLSFVEPTQGPPTEDGLAPRPVVVSVSIEYWTFEKSRGFGFDALGAKRRRRV